MVVINVFDRKAHAVTLATKSTDVVLAGFRQILQQLGGARRIIGKLGGEMSGGVLSSDTGVEWTNDRFQAFLQKCNIAWKSKGTSSPNDLAVLDRCVQTLRRDISSRMMEEPGKSWNEVLGASIVAYNESIHGTMRDSPNDVGKPGNEELQYLRLSDNAKAYAHNNSLAKKRVAKVKDAGAFRRPKKPKAFGRGFEAKWNEKQELEAVQYGTLLKAKDDPRLIDVKSTLPVPVATDTRAERTANPRCDGQKTKSEDRGSHQLPRQFHGGG